MFQRLIRMITLVSVIMSVSLTAFSIVPGQISFQGRLTTSGGSPVADGNYTVQFSIWSLPSGGSQLWTETQNISVSGGIICANLGSVVAIPMSGVFNGDARYLGVKVGADPEMAPRTLITSSAQSIIANGAMSNADTAWANDAIDLFEAGAANLIAIDNAAVNPGDLTSNMIAYQMGYVDDVENLLQIQVATLDSVEQPVASILMDSAFTAYRTQLTFLDSITNAAILSNDTIFLKTMDASIRSTGFKREANIAIAVAPQLRVVTFIKGWLKKLLQQIMNWLDKMLESWLKGFGWIPGFVITWILDAFRDLKDWIISFLF